MERLPMRYRVVVWITGVACVAGLGGWSAVVLTATTPATPMDAVLSGAGLGAVLGVLLVAAFVHALEPPDVDGNPAATR